MVFISIVGVTREGKKWPSRKEILQTLRKFKKIGKDG